MKTICLILIAFATLASCQSDSSKSVKLYQDTTNVSDIDAKLLIVPGKSIGRFSIGQNMAVVDSLKGKPDTSDAAMGKAWAIWYGKKSTGGKRNEIAIFSGYADSTMSSKAVKQIRVISDKFETVEGLNNGTLLSDFTTKYSDFKHVSTYVDDRLHDTILVYDSKAHGIAVEFLRDISRAITVHEKGKPFNDSYYTLKPALKKL